MRPDRTTRALAVWLGSAVFGELLLLRTSTRTLIHIPRLGRFDVSIGILSEIGRLAYYLSIVLVLATLAYVGWRCWDAGSMKGRLVAGAAWSFLVIALLGRIGVIPGATVGWVSLILMAGVLAVTWRGAPSLPVAFFVGAWAFAAWSVLGQGAGGGLSGRTVDITIVVAEALFLLAGASAPLLVRGSTTKSAGIAGLVTMLLVSAGFSLGGSTPAILTIWNLGVPGWFAPISYGIALGCLVITLWSALADHRVITASGVVLMVAGGVGPISTYQTALALTAVILLGVVGPRWQRGPDDKSKSRDTDSTTDARNLVPIS